LEDSEVLKTTSMPKLDRLKLASYLAPNMFWFYEAVAASLGQALGLEVQILQSDCDPLQDPIFLQDQLDIAFICGLPFIQYYRHTPQQLSAIAAPVMQRPRYRNRPVYFADVIVNADSNIATFNDLAGKTLCYNDPGSNSGYNLLRQRLIQAGHSKDFWGKAILSGSHQRSIRWVIHGLADCAAIDSTVLEQELQNFPELVSQLRVVESIGPSPMPPVVLAQHLGPEYIYRIQAALLQPDIALRSAMERAEIRRYAAIESKDYEAIAIQYDAALQAGYERLSEIFS
jgi:phosphonate transport system substrate-binding protein